MGCCKHSPGHKHEAIGFKSGRNIGTSCAQVSNWIVGALSVLHEPMRLIKKKRKGLILTSRLELNACASLPINLTDDLEFFDNENGMSYVGSSKFCRFSERQTEKFVLIKVIFTLSSLFMGILRLLPE